MIKAKEARELTEKSTCKKEMERKFKVIMDTAMGKIESHARGGESSCTVDFNYDTVAKRENSVLNGRGLCYTENC